MAERYKNLVRVLDGLAEKVRGELSFLEVGTYDGRRAVELAKYWAAKGPEHTMRYEGYDLFEDMTPQRSKSEFSKKLLPPAIDVVKQRIEAEAPGTTVTLFKGDTKVTLADNCKNPPYHLIFIDGGHSLSTVAHDWTNCQPLMTADTVIVLDDYYVNRGDYGCRPMVDAMIQQQEKSQKPLLRFELLDPVDVEANGLRIRMVKATLA